MCVLDYQLLCGKLLVVDFAFTLQYEIIWCAHSVREMSVYTACASWLRLDAMVQEAGRTCQCLGVVPTSWVSHIVVVIDIIACSFYIWAAGLAPRPPQILEYAHCVWGSWRGGKWCIYVYCVVCRKA